MESNYSEINITALQKQQPLVQIIHQVPGLILCVAFCTILSFFGGKLFGFNFTGLAWVVPLIAALFVIAKNISSVSFPVLIWLPWILFVFTQLLFVDYSNLDPRVIPVQRTFQMLCPVFVGMAVSTIRPTHIMLESIMKLTRYFAFLLIGIVALKTGILFTGVLPGATGLAAESMTVMLLCSLYINRYLVFKEKKDFQIWVLLAFIPFVALTRAAMAVTLLTFPLAIAPMKLSRRLGALVLIAFLAIVAFYSPRVQSKMFYSQQGEILDIMGPDFNTTGRSSMWANMYSDIGDNIFQGYGTGAGETFAYKFSGHLAYPHNDWLLTLYDYGVLGVSLFALCLILALAHAKKRAEYCALPENKLLFLTGASAIIPFSLLMFTDNIMVYSSYFGNLHFVILGLAYGAFQKQYDDEIF